jgi:crotonobetainyl-CoA:carnitine CoA-transferase CaiB-like acyl-CoA transferase
MALPLEGIRVIDITRAVQGPFAAQSLGDMGADVVKVEIPEGGDGGRIAGQCFAGGISTYYHAMNRNKRGITANLKDPRGVEIVRKLAAKSDVFIENHRPGVMDRLGLGYDDLSQLNPRLIYCAQSGFGASGPYAKRKGLDLVGQAMGGLAYVTGYARGPMCTAGASWADMSSAMQSLYGIMCALYEREKSGRGQKVECCLIDSALSFMALEATAYLNTGTIPGRTGGAWFQSVPYHVFKAKDGWLAFGLGMWPDICRVLERPDLVDDKRFVEPAPRVANREALLKLMRPIVRRRTVDYWVKRGEEREVIIAPVYNMKQIFEDPQFLHNGMLAEVPHPTAGTLRLPGIAPKLSRTPGKIRRHPPLLGEHTAEVLHELGYSDADVAALVAEKVV